MAFALRSTVCSERWDETGYRSFHANVAARTRNRIITPAPVSIISLSCATITENVNPGPPATSQPPKSREGHTETGSARIRHLISNLRAIQAVGQRRSQPTIRRCCGRKLVACHLLPSIDAGECHFASQIAWQAKRCNCATNEHPTDLDAY